MSIWHIPTSPYPKLRGTVLPILLKFEIVRELLVMRVKKMCREQQAKPKFTVVVSSCSLGIGSVVVLSIGQLVNQIQVTFFDMRLHFWQPSTALVILCIMFMFVIVETGKQTLLFFFFFFFKYVSQVFQASLKLRRANQRCLDLNVSRTLEVHMHPLHLPGYANYERRKRKV